MYSYCSLLRKAFWKVVSNAQVLCSSLRKMWQKRKCTVQDCYLMIAHATVRAALHSSCLTPESAFTWPLTSVCSRTNPQLDSTCWPATSDQVTRTGSASTWYPVGPCAPAGYRGSVGLRVCGSDSGLFSADNRTYHFLTEDESECVAWVSSLYSNLSFSSGSPQLSLT